MIVLVATLPLLILTVLGRALLGSWLAPGVFFALYWVAGLLLPILLSPSDAVGIGPLLWLEGAVVAVFVGALAGGGSRAIPLPAGRGRHAGELHVAFFVWATVACTVLGLGAGVLALVSAGYTVGALFSPDNLVAAAHVLSLARYSVLYRPPASSQALLVFAYAGPLFGGVVAAIKCRRSHAWIAAASLLPAVLITGTQTTKGSTFLAIVLWLSAYLATRLAFGRRELFTRRHMSVGVWAIGIVVVLFLASGLARLGSTNLLRVELEVLPSMKDAAVGYLPAFSHWFQGAGFDLHEPALGAYTFAGVFEALGVRARLGGLFTDFVTLSSGGTTNIYSLFRLLIEDFTPPGALVLLILFGAVAGMVYDRVARGSVTALPLMVAFYATAIFSSISSLWAYNSILAALGVFSVGLAAAQWRGSGVLSPA